MSSQICGSAIEIYLTSHIKLTCPVIHVWYLIKILILQLQNEKLSYHSMKLVYPIYDMSLDHFRYFRGISIILVVSRVVCYFSYFKGVLKILKA